MERPRRAARACLDHIVILMPHADVVHPPEWITRHFHVIPGGYHANKQTHNNLICFRDGSYIELVAFVNDADSCRKGHRWGRKKPGIIDFAFVSADGSAAHFDALRSRLGALGDLNVAYEPPLAGGRKRPDGIELKWECTFPAETPEEEIVSRGVQTPFFCHDVAPSHRELRVPHEGAEATHPCGAYGIEELNIFVPADRVTELTMVYSTILDEKNVKWRGEENGALQMKSVNAVEGAKQSLLRIQAPKEDWQKRAVAERGSLIAELRIGGTVGVKSDVLSALEH